MGHPVRGGQSVKHLPKLFAKTIHKGTLTLIGPDGETHEAGGKEPGPHVTLKIHDKALDWKIFTNPELRAAEAFMEGGLTIESPSEHGNGAWELLELFFLNKRNFDLTPNQIFWRGLARGVRRSAQNNPIARSRENVRHHYDLGNDLYRRFLCDDLQYSCAYYETGGETLDEAQTAKKRHIAAKMCLRPGQRVLDIGCGWGGMALYLAHAEDVHVTGVTLSEEQLAVARARAEVLGVSDRVEFRLQDYRDVPEIFDRVVSVGMLEHVGITQLTAYYLKVRDFLAPGGVALIHSISSKAPPGVTSPFLRKYIFPGGYAPSLSEAAASLEKCGLWLTDCEIWRVHYAETLLEWRKRFQADRPAIEAMYDAQFGRMWEFYLAACEGAFRYGASNVFQMQLARERDDAPLNRNYISEAEAALRAKEPDFMPAILASTGRALGFTATNAPSEI